MDSTTYIARGRLVSTVSRELRRRGFDGDIWQPFRRNADMIIENAVASIFLDLPTDVVNFDRELALRLIYAGVGNTSLSQICKVSNSAQTRTKPSPTNKPAAIAGVNKRKSRVEIALETAGVKF